MGIEKTYALAIKDAILGKGPKGGGRDLIAKGGGTPNHYSEARALSYVSSNDEAGRTHVLDLLKMQDKNGFWSHAEADEWGSTSHCAWHLTAEVGIWLSAVLRRDEAVLGPIRAHIASVLWALQKCSTPKGKVVICGARCHLAKDERTGETAADQTPMMDRLLAHVTGKKYKTPKPIESPDWASLWLVQKMPGQELELMRKLMQDARPPVVQNPMGILRTNGGHVCWYDNNPDISASFFAYADYGTGEERYGFDPTWNKGHKVPDGVNPFPIPRPPGKEMFSTVLRKP